MKKIRQSVFMTDTSGPYTDKDYKQTLQKVCRQFARLGFGNGMIPKNMKEEK